MPHIHALYDFVVSVFIVRRGRTLLAYHKKYNEWLPVGGHIELDEDPLQALWKEVREECGLKIRLFAQAPNVKHAGVKPLPAPDFLDVHRIKGKHKHIALIYLARAAAGRVKLEKREFREYAWLSREDLDKKKYKLTRSIRFYCEEALKRDAHA